MKPVVMFKVKCGLSMFFKGILKICSWDRPLIVMIGLEFVPN